MIYIKVLKKNTLCCKNQTTSLKNACKLHMALKKLNFQSSGRKIAPVWAGLDLATFPVWLNTLLITHSSSNCNCLNIKLHNLHDISCNTYLVASDASQFKLQSNCVVVIFFCYWVLRNEPCTVLIVFFIRKFLC